MKKIIKIGCWVIVAILFLIAAASFVLFTQKDKVTQKVIAELNKSLITEVSVDKIRLTIFQHFPHVSVAAEGVHVKSPFADDSDPLMYAENFFLHIDVFSLLKKNYSITQIDIDKAVFYIKIWKDGRKNYVFWKNSGNSTAAVDFHLNKVRIKNSDFIYDDKRSKQYFDYHIHKLTATGDFYDKLTNIEGKGELFIRSHQMQDLLLAERKEAEFQADFSVISAEDIFRLNKAQLTIEGLKFLVDGDVGYQDTKEFVEMKVVGDRISLAQLMKTLPPSLHKYVKTYQTQGLLDVKMLISGSIAGSNYPDIKAAFALINGSISDKASKLSLEQIQLKGNFSNGKRNKPESYILNVSNLSAKLKDDKIAGKLQITNFRTPLVKFEGLVQCDLANLNAFLKLSDLEELQGELDGKIFFENQFSKFKNLSAQDFKNCKAKGVIRLDDVLAKTANSKHLVKIEHCDANIDNNRMQVNAFKGELDSLDLAGNFAVTNVFPALFIKEQSLYISGDVRSKNLNVEPLLSKSTSDSNKKTSDTSSYDFFGKMDIDLGFVVEHFLYETLKAKNVSGKVNYQKNKLKINDLHFDALGGTADAKINLSLSEQGKIGIIASVQAKKIDISESFALFDNFGQQTLTSEQLKGKLTADVQCSMIYDLKSGIDKKSLVVDADVKIENGELNNFELMQSLSKFMDEESLKNIKFSSLENKISIKDQLIIIPNMSIRMNDMDFSISGTHSFEQDVEYHLAIRLSELLSKRRLAKNKAEEEFGVVQDQGSRLTLFIKIYGNLNNPKIKYDSKQAKQQFAQTIKEEKADVKQVLNKEFEWAKDEEAKAMQQSWKEQEVATGFLIDWSEETDTLTEKLSVPEPTKKEKGEFKIIFEDE